MYCDPRGGHNRKPIDEGFFKIWSPQMAYVLGLIIADGAIEDTRKSSRTCYIQISNNDRSLLKQIKEAMSSGHKIYVRPPRMHAFFGNNYQSSESFHLRIGNKKIFQDLINLQVLPRKSLRLKLPPVPDKYFCYFLRGYFDGDGCVSVYQRKGRKSKIIQVIFTCGSFEFLEKIMLRINQLLSVGTRNLFKNSRAFKLIYNEKKASLGILSFLYENLNGAPYLSRKYEIYKNFLSESQSSSP